jgi:MFS family permease
MTGSLTRYVRTFTGFGRDARLFLLTTIVFGAALSLYWIDFNLYLESIGLDNQTIGWMLSLSMLAGVIVALPASALSDRFGRRSVMAAGMALVAAALLAFLPGQRLLLFIGVAALGAGSQMVSVVQIPFIAEHTLPEQRNEYFSVWSAFGFLTSLVSAVIGAQMATAIAHQLGFASTSAPYQILLAGVAVLGLIALGTVYMLTSDRPAIDRIPHPARSRFGLVILDRGLFFRLLLPGFLTSLGAGQLIPFLNVFIQTKFDLGLPAVNAVFAVTSLGTAVAILAQPALASRFGRIASIVLVQGVSIPFLVVLGFSPVLWTVVVALTVRNSLMNAGSPIFDAFSMEKVSAAERATLAAGMTLLWSLGWTFAPIYYGALQAALGFTAGYAVDFVTIIVLYTIATSLLWIWFRDSDRAAAEAAEAAEDAEPVVVPIATEAPALLDHA